MWPPRSRRSSVSTSLSRVERVLAKLHVTPAAGALCIGLCAVLFILHLMASPSSLHSMDPAARLTTSLSPLHPIRHFDSKSLVKPGNLIDEPGTESPVEYFPKCEGMYKNHLYEDHYLKQTRADMLKFNGATSLATPPAKPAKSAPSASYFYEHAVYEPALNIHVSRDKVTIGDESPIEWKDSTPHPLLGYQRPRWGIPKPIMQTKDQWTFQMPDAEEPSSTTQWVFEENVDRLMIVSHPDDETLFAFKELLSHTLATQKWLEAQRMKTADASTQPLPPSGWKVIVVTNSFTGMRVAELFHAMRYFHVSHFSILSHLDSMNRWLKMDSRMIDYITQVMYERPWKQIVTHNLEGEYGHIQHFYISRLVQSLVFNPPEWKRDMKSKGNDSASDDAALLTTTSTRDLIWPRHDAEYYGLDSAEALSDASDGWKWVMYQQLQTKRQLIFDEQEELTRVLSETNSSLIDSAQFAGLSPAESTTSIDHVIHSIPPQIFPLEYSLFTFCSTRLKHHFMAREAHQRLWKEIKKLSAAKKESSESESDSSTAGTIQLVDPLPVPGPPPTRIDRAGSALEQRWTANEVLVRHSLKLYNDQQYLVPGAILPIRNATTELDPKTTAAFLCGALGMVQSQYELWSLLNRHLPLFVSSDPYSAVAQLLTPMHLSSSEVRLKYELLEQFYPSQYSNLLNMHVEEIERYEAPLRMERAYESFRLDQHMLDRMRKQRLEVISSEQLPRELGYSPFIVDPLERWKDWKKRVDTSGSIWDWKEWSCSA